MKPEPKKAHIDVWVLAQLGTVNHATSQGCPWTVMWDNNTYETLEDAQHAQTFLALKSQVKYEIFHLEFPLAN